MLQPINYKEAIMSAEAENWKRAIRKELVQLKENNTWTEVDKIEIGFKEKGRWL